eukprot:jgi/Astpho2/1686/e_gw1.00032.150.1_t
MSISLVIGGAVTVVSVLPYVLHLGALRCLKPQDLKKKYGAQWALVTGASSGIGKAIAKQLAAQNLNVVLVALPGQELDGTMVELQKQHHTQQFRKVGVNLGATGYLKDIAAATSDISVQVVFCNAGYMCTGFFERRPLESHLANLECNSTSAVQITHHLLELMVQKGLKGCFVFTSSAAAAMPSPFTVLYAATKSFLSAFGASLAAEVRHHGIDVLVVHPSPVRSNFYDNAHKLGILEFFKSQAVSPDLLPSQIFAAVGRTVWVDLGSTAVLFRLAMKIIDYNLLATLSALVATWLPDFQQQMRANGTKKVA